MAHNAMQTFLSSPTRNVELLLSEHTPLSLLFGSNLSAFQSSPSITEKLSYSIFLRRSSSAKFIKPGARGFLLASKLDLQLLFLPEPMHHFLRLLSLFKMGSDGLKLTLLSNVDDLSRLYLEIGKCVVWRVMEAIGPRWFMLASKVARMVCPMRVENAGYTEDRRSR